MQDIRIFLYMWDSTGKAHLITSRVYESISQAMIRQEVDDMAGLMGYRNGDGCAHVVDDQGQVLEKLEFMIF